MNKFKNNTLIKNIIILLASGAIAKIIGMFSKIIYTRTAGVEVVSLYTLITPCFMLVISICQFSFPIAISKLAAENKYDNKSLLIASFKIGMIVDILLMIILLMFSKTIANMLHNEILYKGIISIIFIIPFVTITSIQRGFLHGKENMLPPSITNITEEIIKIILIIATLPLAIAKSNIAAVCAIILYNVILEITSIIIMHKHIKKYFKYKTNKSKENIAKKILGISIPTTLIRLISSVGFFLEPIILTKVLISQGYSSNYIALEYGIINSYIIPLLSIPSFFSVSIASALLPNITQLYINNKINEFKNKLLKLLSLSILIGAVCLTIILLFPSSVLNIIYGVSFGENYIYFLAPFFILIYIQPTLTSTIQATSNTNKLLFVSFATTFLKVGSLIIFGISGFGIESLIFSTIIGIITTTLLEIIIIIKEIKKTSKGH